MSSQTQGTYNAEPAPTLVPAFRLLLEGVARHSVKGDIEEFRKFRSQLCEISRSIDQEQGPAEVLDTAEQAVNLLKDYGHSTSRRLRQQGTELHAVVKMLLDTFQDLTIAGPDKMRELKELGTEISATSDGEQLTRCKLKLTECLNEIRLEAERFQQGADGGLAAASSDPKIDRLTGLEGRESAEAALAMACAAEAPGSAIIVMVRRISIYNVRFGRAVGDKVLRFFAESLVQRLPFKIPPFRWTGPALLMLRPGTVDQNVPTVRRALEQRIEYEVETESRNILLPVSARWEVLPMMTDARLVINKIDAFVAYEGSPGTTRDRGS